MTRPNTTRFGLVRTTLIDYPGHVAAVVFSQGCNFRCPYCHNPELVVPEAEVKTMKESRGNASGHPVPGTDHGMLTIDEILAFIEKRKHVLDGIVLSGGEPLANTATAVIAAAARDAGLLVKIDTNGSFPERLIAIAPDFVAVDIKCDRKRYDRVTNESATATVARLEQTVAWVLSSGVEHEFRTTVAPGIVDYESIRDIVNLIQGASRYVLTEFRGGRTLDPGFASCEPYPDEVIEHMRKHAADRGVPCTIRSHRRRPESTKLA